MPVLSRVVVAVLFGSLFVPSAATAGVGPTHWSVAWTATFPFYGSVMTSDAHGTIVIGYDGQITALSAEGSELWTTQDQLGEVVNRPVLIDDVVVVPTTDRIVAVSRSDGGRLWSTELDGPSLAVAERDHVPVVLATSEDRMLRVLDATTGAVVVERPFPVPPPDGAPLISGSAETAVAAWGGPDVCCTIAGFDTSDGEMLWKRQVTDESTEPLVHGDVVLVALNGTKASRGRVVAFDVSTGELQWSTSVRGIFRPTLESAVTDDFAVVTTRDGTVIALDGETGAMRWHSERTIPDSHTHPQIAAEHVFLTPHSTDLVAFDKASGEVVSRGPIEQTIVVTDSNVAAGHLQLLVTNGFESQLWNVDPEGLRTD